MDFDWNEEQDTLRKSLAAAYSPGERAALDALESAEQPELESRLRAEQLRLSPLGYLDVDHGTRRLAAIELLASLSPSLFLATEVSFGLFGGLLAAHSGHTLCHRLLAELRAGRLLGAVAASDAPDGQAPDAGPTVARRDAQDLVLDGSKPFVTNGPVADWLAVVVQLEGAGEPQPVICLLESTAPGLRRGPRIDTLGYRGLAVCALRLEGVRVPPDRVLAAPPQVLAMLRDRQDLALALGSVGLAQRSFGAARSHARSHQRDGKPIIRRQQVAFALAEMLTQLQSAQWLVRRAAWSLAQGDPEADTLVGCAKVYASEAAEQASRRGLQLQAGAGYVSGSVAERTYRDASYAALAGTTNERSRMAIAEALLRRFQVQETLP